MQVLAILLVLVAVAIDPAAAQQLTPTGSTPPGLMQVGRSSNGGVAFAPDHYPLAIHDVPGLNDGLFGNDHSWIQNTGSTPNIFGGIALANLTRVEYVAWGRDNTGVLTDRTTGTYQLQYTLVAGAGLATTFTGNPSTGWADYGSAVSRTGGISSQRQVYQLTPAISARALRLVLSSNQICIDEFEIIGAFIGGCATTTFAGVTGQDGFLNHVNPLQAKFTRPSEMGRLPDGSYLVTDDGNSCLRKVNGTTLEVTTLSGLCGTPGNTGAAVGANVRFSVFGLTVTSLGRVFVGDRTNKKVWEVNSTTGGAATFCTGFTNLPEDMAEDPTTGDIYVADGWFDAPGSLRRCPANGGTAIFVASFDFPVGVHVDYAGRLYVGDSTTQQIFTVNRTTNVKTLFCGAGGEGNLFNVNCAAAKFNRPIMITSAGDALYVVDHFNHAIKKIENGFVTTFVGGAASSVNGACSTATLHYPIGVLALGYDRLLVSEWGSHDIRMLAIPPPPSTQDPAVSAFCDAINARCDEMNTLCSGINAAVHGDCIAAVDACSSVHTDCVAKAQQCSLV